MGQAVTCAERCCARLEGPVEGAEIPGNRGWLAHARGWRYPRLDGQLREAAEL